MRHIDRSSAGSAPGGKPNQAPGKGIRNTSSNNVYALLSEDADLEAGDDTPKPSSNLNRGPHSGSFNSTSGGKASLHGSGGISTPWQQQHQQQQGAKQQRDNSSLFSAPSAKARQQKVGQQESSRKQNESLYTSASDYSKPSQGGEEEQGAYAPRRHAPSQISGDGGGALPAATWLSDGSSTQQEEKRGEWQLRKSLALLVLLYHMQGIPLGLTLGSL